MAWPGSSYPSIYDNRAYLYLHVCQQLHGTARPPYDRRLTLLSDMDTAAPPSTHPGQISSSDGNQAVGTVRVLRDFTTNHRHCLTQQYPIQTRLRMLREVIDHDHGGSTPISDSGCLRFRALLAPFIRWSDTSIPRVGHCQQYYQLVATPQYNHFSTIQHATCHMPHASTPNGES